MAIKIKKSVKESVEELNFVKLNDEPIEIEYIEDEHDESRDFQPSFWWENKRYYLDDFIRIHNNPWVSGAYTYPEYIHAYESDNYHNPLYIEVADDGDYVNVYEEREIANESCKGKKCNESKQPRIVEYISPERQEINKRAAEINDKWYKDVTEDDIQFLKDNGLDYDTERRSVVFADTRKKVDFPYYSSWSWDRDNGKIDWIDKTAKAGERNRSDEFDFGRATRLGRDNHNYRTSDELKRTSKELADAKRWGTERQEKVWQGKHDREEAKLADKRRDAYNRDWRVEQNQDMKKDYKTLRSINYNLDPDNYGYDARIEYAQKRKADREQELLRRYKDELDSYQRQIDDAKAEKDNALKRKAQILRKPQIDNPDDEV